MMYRAALLAACCVCLRAQPASVVGVVINQATGKPIAGAHLRLMSAASASEGQPYGALSDREGKFSIAALPAGTYLGEVNARGFYYVPPKGEAPVWRVTVKAGQQITDLKVTMAPEAIIAGRILDDNGDPIVSSVSAEDAAGSNFGGNGSSDDRGEYRLSVPPGKYYVVARPNQACCNFGPGQEPEIRTDGSAPAIYGETYYPGTPGKAKATVIEAAPGAELDGMDIHLARQAHAAEISGTVAGAPEESFNSMVLLLHNDDPKLVSVQAATGTYQEGRFEFANVPQGKYRLFATLMQEKIKLYSQPVDVRLDGGDATGVSLLLAPGAEVNGTLEVTGGTGQEKFSVKLSPQVVGEPREADVDANGAFQIKDVAPARYSVSVTPMPENAYVKSVRLNGAESAEGNLEFSQAGQRPSLKIVVARNGGQLSGRLLGKDGAPVTGTPLTVILTDSAEAIDFERAMKQSEDGTYRFPGIRPGKYKVFAFDHFEFAAAPDFTAMIQRLAAKAEEIDIKEGDRKVKDLKLMTKDADDAKPSQ